ncbi:MAG: WG repeat-containing protein [Acidobacteriota bacterium]|nr:WG repeat-containing protein [Acidobacteriota bacterium]
MNLQLFLLVLFAPLLITPVQQNKVGAALKPVYVNGHWGYADPSGKLAIEARFDAGLPFVEGLARVGIVDEELPEIDARPNLLWGYVDEEGRVVVDLRYNALRAFSEGLAAGAILEKEQSKGSVYARQSLDSLRWGYADREGRTVIPTQFFDAGDFSEGLAPVNIGGQKDTNCRRPGNYGYIDKTGKFVIKPQFATATAFKDGIAGVSVGHVDYVGRCLCCGPRFVGKHGHVNRNGKFVVERTSDGDEPLSDIDRSECRR